MPPRILIIKDNLTAKTGTTKLTLDIARALKTVGADVDLVFFHSDGTEKSVMGALDDVKIEVYENRMLYAISKAIQAPIIGVYLQDAFTSGDSVNLFGQYLFAQKLNSMRTKYDHIIFMNMWSALGVMFLAKELRDRSAIYFHEPPVFDGFPRPIRSLLKMYVGELCLRTSTHISLTEPMRKAIEEKTGIKTIVLQDAFVLRPVKNKKEDFVLLDTRWTYIRNPFFAIGIAERLPGTRFIMCGKFGSVALRERFEKELAEHRVEDRIQIREENTEAELDILYSTARCFIRWSNPSVVETGPSYGLIQAISNGCVPVISMDLGSSPRVAEKLGPEFAVDNTAAGFADAIRRLFNDEEFFAKAVQNVINWRNSYTGKEYGDRLLSIIQGQS